MTQRNPVGNRNPPPPGWEPLRCLFGLVCRGLIPPRSWVNPEEPPPPIGSRSGSCTLVIFPICRTTFIHQCGKQSGRVLSQVVLQLLFVGGWWWGWPWCCFPGEGWEVFSWMEMEMKAPSPGVFPKPVAVPSTSSVTTSSNCLPAVYPVFTSLLTTGALWQLQCSLVTA